MGYVFLSHAKEDYEVVREIAKGLERAGYATWYYEEHGTVGQSYLLETSLKIQHADAVLVLVSPASTGSNQVTPELVRAHESNTPLLPLMRGMTRAELKQRKPDWEQALGSVISIDIPSGGVREILHRVIAGLAALGIEGRPTAPGPSQRATVEPSPGGEGDAAEPAADAAGELEVSLSVGLDEYDGEAELTDGSSTHVATIVDMHPDSGVLADLVLQAGPLKRDKCINVSFESPLRDLTVRRKVSIDLSKYPAIPVLYLSLARLRLGIEWWRHESPVVLRVYDLAQWAGMDWPRRSEVQGVGRQPCRGGWETDEAVGFLPRGTFKELIARGTRLPAVAKRRFTTGKKNQRRIVVHGVAAGGEGVRRLADLRIEGLLMAPAGVPKVDCTFRVDQDGRFTIMGRDLLGSRPEVRVVGWGG